MASLKDEGKGLITREALNEADLSFTTGVREGVFAGQTYRWQASFLADSPDRDGDPATTVVRFSRSFGYEGSPFNHGGYPVAGLFLELEDGQGKSALRADVTPVVLNPDVNAAWTGAGELLFERSVRLSGLDHDCEGKTTMRLAERMSCSWVRSFSASASCKRKVLSSTFFSKLWLRSFIIL